MAANPAVTAFVALWKSAEDKVGSVDLTALAAHPHTAWADPELDAAEAALRKAKVKVSVVESITDAVDKALAAPPDATHGPDCYLLTALKAALGARYEAGWEKRIEAYAKASGWTGVDLEDPAAPAASSSPVLPVANLASEGGPAAPAARTVQPLPGLGVPASAVAAAPGAARLLPGQLPAAVLAPAATFSVERSRALAAWSLPSVQRAMAGIAANAKAGNTAELERKLALLATDDAKDEYGDDGVGLMIFYIQVVLGRHISVRASLVELHAGLHLAPP